MRELESFLEQLGAPEAGELPGAIAAAVRRRRRRRIAARAAALSFALAAMLGTVMIVTRGPDAPEAPLLAAAPAAEDRAGDRPYGLTMAALVQRNRGSNLEDLSIPRVAAGRPSDIRLGGAWRRTPAVEALLR